MQRESHKMFQMWREKKNLTGAMSSRREQQVMKDVAQKEGKPWGKIEKEEFWEQHLWRGSDVR